MEYSLYWKSVRILLNFDVIFMTMELVKESMQTKPMGGFLPFETQCFKKTPRNVLDLWKIDHNNAFTFKNARSALSYFLNQLQIKRLWLPSYICSEMEALQSQVEINYYPLQANLSPDLEKLDRLISKRDCVLAIDYFGRDPDPLFRTFVQTHSDILWVEDRAHALWPSSIPWSNWVLYSPRKLFGVPDGGILVNQTGNFKRPEYANCLEALEHPPTLMRFEDEEERYNELWYSAYVEQEEKMAVSMKKMSRLSRAVLESIDPTSIMNQRKKNYNQLFDAFPEIALLSTKSSEFVPLGFPIRLKNCDKIWEKLCEKKIYAARHWKHLAQYSIQSDFVISLSNETMTLPSDHRYTEDDMNYIIDTLKDLKI